MPGALWVWVESQVAGPGPLSGSRLLAVVRVALLLAAVLVPRRAALALAGRRARRASLVTSVLAWERLIDAPEDAVFAGGLERSWIDDAVAADASVTKLYIETPRARRRRSTRHALFLTEAFNATVDRAAYIGDSVPDGLPIERVDVGADGTLRDVAGESARRRVRVHPAGHRARRRARRHGDERPSSSSGEPTAPSGVTNATSSEDVRERSTAPSARGAGTRSG